MEVSKLDPLPSFHSKNLCFPGFSSCSISFWVLRNFLTHYYSYYSQPSNIQLQELTSNKCPTEPSFLCPNTYFRTLVEVCSPTIFLIFLAPEPKPIITRINFQRVSYIGAFFCVPQNRVSGHLLKYVLQLYLLAPEPKPQRKNLRTGIWFLFLVHVSITLSFKCYWPQNPSNNYGQKQQQQIVQKYIGHIFNGVPCQDCFCSLQNPKLSNKYKN